MRCLGIDFGTVRIGLALSDPLEILASPLDIYERKHYKKDIAYICELVKKYDCGTVVLGLPMHMSGVAGEKVRQVEEFAGSLKNATGVKIEYIDERLTSVQGERLMSETKSKKQFVDSVCAAIILQTYLDKIKQRI